MPKLAKKPIYAYSWTTKPSLLSYYSLNAPISLTHSLLCQLYHKCIQHLTISLFFLSFSARIHRLSASPPFPTLTDIAIPTIPPMLLY